jgi:hypothetical protein
MTILAGTMQTDPRSGGIKRSSGVNVMPAIAEGKIFLLLNFDSFDFVDLLLACSLLLVLRSLYIYWT